MTEWVKRSPSVARVAMEHSNAEKRIPILQLLEAFSTALDLVSPVLRDHHRKTAWLANWVGRSAGLRGIELRNVVFAALLHDIGCLSLVERFKDLEFERDFGLTPAQGHAETGFHLLEDFAPFSEIAQLVRHQHRRWDGVGSPEPDESVSLGSHVLHLADRVAICLLPSETSEVLGRDEIRRRISGAAGRMFHPDVARAFLDGSNDWPWHELNRMDTPSLAPEDLPGLSLKLGLEQLEALARLFGRLIDFRSLHTATHSSGVAAASEALSAFVGFDETNRRRMFIAGLLHDLGKIAIPTELLDKPSRLTAEEFEIVKRHAAYTDQIVAPLGELGGIRTWAAQHHERFDGSGYPAGLQGGGISLGGKVLAAADVFTALTESRPYRAGLSPAEALRIVQEMTANRELDPDVVAVLGVHVGSIDTSRAKAQARARAEYSEFRHRAGIEVHDV